MVLEFSSSEQDSRGSKRSLGIDGVSWSFVGRRLTGQYNTQATNHIDPPALSLVPSLRAVDSGFILDRRYAR